MKDKRTIQQNREFKSNRRKGEGEGESGEKRNGNEDKKDKTEGVRGSNMIVDQKMKQKRSQRGKQSICMVGREK